MRQKLRSVKNWSRYVRRTAVQGSKIRMQNLLDELESRIKKGEDPLSKEVTKLRAKAHMLISGTAGGRPSRMARRIVKVIAKVITETAITNLGLQSKLPVKKLDRLRAVGIRFVMLEAEAHEIKDESKRNVFVDKAATELLAELYILLGERDAKRFIKERENLYRIVLQTDFEGM